MFDEYFEEVNAKKRHQILKSLEAQPGEEEALEQIRKLNELRYQRNRNGKYVDLFLRVLVSLRAQAGVNPSKFSKSKFTKQTLGDMHTLCLDRTDEFSPDILYREMCNMIALYISLCYESPRYRQSGVGFRKMSDERLEDKIRSDLNELWNEIPKYIEIKDEYLILRRAMDDMMDQKIIRTEPDAEDDEYV